MSCARLDLARGARGAKAGFAKRKLRAAGAASACKRETIQPTSFFMPQRVAQRPAQTADRS
jgi:hypothetical protein